MSISEEDKEEEIIPRLALLEGGKGKNWLLGLGCGTTFAVRMPKTDPFVSTIFRVVWKGRRVVTLSVEGGTKIAVDSIVFSRAAELLEVLEERNDDPWEVLSDR